MDGLCAAHRDNQGNGSRIEEAGDGDLKGQKDGGNAILPGHASATKLGEPDKEGNPSCVKPARLDSHQPGPQVIC